MRRSGQGDIGSEGHGVIGGNRESGNTLVATLVTVAIILVLVVVLFKGSSLFGSKSGVATRPDGKGTTVLGGAKWAAEDDVCRNNLSQVRQAIQLFESTNDDKPPASLEDTHIGASFYSCPIGHEPYQYDPATGQVKCTHPGHGKY